MVDDVLAIWGNLGAGGKWGHAKGKWGSPNIKAELRMSPYETRKKSDASQKRPFTNNPQAPVVLCMDKINRSADAHNFRREVVNFLDPTAGTQPRK